MKLRAIYYYFLYACVVTSIGAYAADGLGMPLEPIEPPVIFKGASARNWFNRLNKLNQTHPHLVTLTVQTRRFLGSIKVLSISLSEVPLLVCQKKQGWLKESHECEIPASSRGDILRTRQSLQMTGLSAQRLVHVFEGLAHEELGNLFDQFHCENAHSSVSYSEREHMNSLCTLVDVDPFDTNASFVKPTLNFRKFNSTTPPDY